MKYEDLQKCISIAEKKCYPCGMKIADANVSLIGYRNGSNGRLEQKVRFEFDFDDVDVALEVAPKGGE